MRQTIEAGFMQLIQGIAGDVTAKAKDASGPAALLFKVNGKPVRIEQPDNDDKESASDEDRVEALSVRDGDSVIVAGDEMEGVLSGLACKNLTQGQATYRAPAKIEWLMAWLFFSGAIVAFWLNALPERENSLYPNLPWLNITMGLLSALLGLFCLFSIIQNHVAAFRVDWASLETVTGVVGGFRRLEDQKGLEGLAEAEIAGRRVLLNLSGGFTFENGDVLAVTGQQMPHGLRGFAYRNVTHPISTINNNMLDLFFACFWPLVFLVLLAVFFLGGDPNNPWNLLRSVIAVALMMTSLIVILDRYYQWRLYREAYRRMEQACAGLAKGEA